MSDAYRRGHTLAPGAVAQAKEDRERHIRSLEKKREKGTATSGELRELRWKWVR